MPFQLKTQDELFLFYVGRCRHSFEPGYTRFVIISLRGEFTMNEALPFIYHCKVRETVPFHGAFFQNSLAINTMGMSVELPLAEKFCKIKYYIEHYNVPRLISQYEWNVARHDVHQLASPGSFAPKVFGDHLTDEDVDREVQNNNLLRVITVYEPA